MEFDIVEFLEDKYGKLPSHRQTKLRVLYDLAYHRKQGVIVELGTNLGLGTAALCMGIEQSGWADMISVYTVDDYCRRTGWAGEEYRPRDRMLFENRMKTLGFDPILINKSIQAAGMEWENIPIGVLFWDAGVPDAMKEDILLWEKHVLVGGTIYLSDTFSKKLGSVETAERLSPFYEIIRDDPGVLLMRKVKNHD